ncbi:MAG TPA: hypothetical protein VEM38_06650 [Burkholderiales bacterium]|nr:hypothetical protein [Burkholderiales bacterium]
MPFATINGIRINYLVHQTGQNTLEQILRFKSRFETSAQAA